VDVVEGGKYDQIYRFLLELGGPEYGPDTRRREGVSLRRAVIWMLFDGFVWLRIFLATRRLENCL
jgi:hypothetical protein